MRACYTSDDFYICFSIVDLEKLKEDRQISGFILFFDMVFGFLIKNLKNKKEASSILISKKFRKIKLVLDNSDFKDLIEKGIFRNRIAFTNVYIASQRHNLNTFNEKSLFINSLFFKIEKEK